MRSQSIAIDTDNIRPIKDEHGNILDDEKFLRFVKDVNDDFDRRGIANPFCTPNFINCVEAMVNELDNGATIQQVKDRHVQQEIDFTALEVNPKLKEIK